MGRDSEVAYLQPWQISMMELFCYKKLETVSHIVLSYFQLKQSILAIVKAIFMRNIDGIFIIWWVVVVTLCRVQYGKYFTSF